MSFVFKIKFFSKIFFYLFLFHLISFIIINSLGKNMHKFLSFTFFLINFIWKDKKSHLKSQYWYSVHKWMVEWIRKDSSSQFFCYLLSTSDTLSCRRIARLKSPCFFFLLQGLQYCLFGRKKSVHLTDIKNLLTFLANKRTFTCLNVKYFSLTLVRIIFNIWKSIIYSHRTVGSK